MGSIRQTIDSDSQKAQRDIEKLNAQLVKMREQLKNTSETGKAGQADMNKLTQMGVQHASAMAAQFVSVNAVVGLVRSSVQALAADYQTAASEATKFANQFAKTVGGTGDLQRAAAVEQFAESIPGVTRSQALSSFDAVSAGVPGGAFEARAGLARVVARTAALGDIEGLGRTAGRFMESGAFGAATNETLAEKALLARQAAGSQAGQLESASFQQALRALSAAGVDQDKALALGVGGLRAGLGGEAFLKVGTAVQGGASIEKLLSNPAMAAELLGAEQASKLALINQAEVAGLQSQFQRAPTADIIGEQLAGFAQSRAGQFALADQVQSANLEKAQRGIELEAFQANMIKRQLEADTFGSPTGFYRRTAFEFDQWAYQLMGDSPTEAARAASGTRTPEGGGGADEALNILRQIRDNTQRPPVGINTQTEGAR